MELSLATRTVNDHAVLEVGGEIDVYTAPFLRERLVDLIGAGEVEPALPTTVRGAYRLIVDLSRVDFLDSTGLGVLVGAYRRLRASDAGLALVVPDRLNRVFGVAGLDSVFDIYATVEDAVARTIRANVGGSAGASSGSR